MVIHLNLSTTPIQIQYGEVLEVFQSQRECFIKHNEFFQQSQEGEPTYFLLLLILVVSL